VRTNPPRDEDHLVHLPVESCELLTGIQLVYADDRDRQRTVALEDAALLDFGQVKAFRRPPAYRGQRNFPGWWWSVTTRSHIAYESWLERHHIIEADCDIRVTGISGQPFQLTWPEGRKQMRHVPDLFCRMLEGNGVVTDCRPADKDRRGPSGQVRLAGVPASRALGDPARAAAEHRRAVRERCGPTRDHP
jgi:hypothetical protein